MKNDIATGKDHATLKADQLCADHANWKAHMTLEKFHGTEAKGNLADVPYEVLEREGNLLTNAGIQLLEDLLIGAGGTVYSNANAYIAVGTSATAADATDTTLTIENDRKGMEATFPSRSGQVLTFKSSFATVDSDGVWAEWGILNAAAAGTLLNHKIDALGTKSGGTWNLTVTITIS